MSAATSIQWTERTWNPTTGCEKVSPGCASCYAVRDALRLSGNPNPRIRLAYEGTTTRHGNGQLDWTGLLKTHEDRLLAPLSWRKPCRVFVNSMSDLFHEDVPWWFIDEVFATMALAPRHTFQILTKRPSVMRDYLARPGKQADIAVAVFKRCARVLRAAERRSRKSVESWPLPNVWLGVSAEDQLRADERIPLLLQTPAAVRFVSAEPLLGPVNLQEFVPGYGWERSSRPMDSPLSWVIVGGESGPGARPMRVAWARSIVQQCKAAGVACFVKQLGANAEGDPRPSDRIDPVSGARTLTVMQVVEIHDRKGGDPAEWPEDLRVRDFPVVHA